MLYHISFDKSHASLFFTLVIEVKNVKKRLLNEMVGGEPYEYYPLGEYIVTAPGVCGGRPTFKYTRIDVRHALGLVVTGRTIEEVANCYQIPVEAVKEALQLASHAFDKVV